MLGHHEDIRLHHENLRPAFRTLLANRADFRQRLRDTRAVRAADRRVELSLGQAEKTAHEMEKTAHEMGKMPAWTYCDAPADQIDTAFSGAELCFVLR